MGYREARELARIRHELRERLRSDRQDGTADVLARLRLAAEEDPSLRAEYQRWRLRFDLRGVTAPLRAA